jgi:hypothetical protein
MWSGERIVQALVAAMSLNFLSAVAQDEDANSAAKRRIAHSSFIPLPGLVNEIPRFAKDGSGARIVNVCSADGRHLYVVTQLEEIGNFIEEPSGKHPIEQRIIPIRDNAGVETDTITALDSGVVQKVAFLRANLDHGNDADQVIFVTANRVVAKMTELAPVDFVVYRYQSEPIIDGELIFFAPFVSWQSSGNYGSASDALEKAFGVKIGPEENCTGGP